MLRTLLIQYANMLHLRACNWHDYQNLKNMYVTIYINSYLTHLLKNNKYLIRWKCFICPLWYVHNDEKDNNECRFLQIENQTKNDHIDILEINWLINIEYVMQIFRLFWKIWPYTSRKKLFKYVTPIEISSGNMNIHSTYALLVDFIDTS